MIDGSCTDKRYAPINPILFGRERCAPSHAFGPAKRTHWLLHFVVSGKGLFETERGRYTLQSGDMFVIAPLEQTYYRADDTHPWEYIWLGFSCEGALPHPLSDVMHCPAARPIFEEVSAAMERSGGRSEFLLSRIWARFGLLMEQEPERVDYVQRAVELIRTAYVREDLSVQGIADALGLDRSYLSVLFKRKLSQSPSDYLLQHRMKHAVRLLTELHTSITVTAHSVGYPDVYTFSKAFKRHTGRSPRAFLREYCATPSPTP